MKLALTVTVTLVLLVQMMPPVLAADDAGSGADAPDARALALTVAPGTLSGQISPRHDADWYRVLVPADHAVEVRYEVVGGDTWNSATLYDDGSTMSTAIQDGRSGIVQTTDGVAVIHIDGWWGVTDYELTISLVAVPPQNDGGTGGDAGNGLAQATPFAGGELAGRVDRGVGDHVDWYRVTAEPHEFVEVASNGQHRDVELRAVDGTLLAAIGQYPDHATTAAVVPPDGVVLIGVTEWSAWDYRLLVTRHDRADVAVEDLTVTPIPVRTEAGDLPASPQRQVEVTLSNPTSGVTRNAHVLVYTTQDGPASARRVLADHPLSLAPGETLSRVYDWDTLGQVGDMRLHVEVFNAFDRDPANNAASVESFSLVGGTIIGVDALNHGVSETVDTPGTYGPDLEVRAATEYGVHGHGPFAHVVHPWANSGAWIRTGSDGEGSPRMDGGVGALGNWVSV